MKARRVSFGSLPGWSRCLLLVCASVGLVATPGHADTASVVTAANTLLTTSTAQTSPYALTTPVSTTYSLAYDKKWTNLPGTPPDSNRNGPVIGGGPVSFNTSSSAAYELSATVSSGQTVSPRAAALTLATTVLSTAGYNTFYEIRNADDVIRSSPTTATTEPWQYGDYHVAVLGTPSTTAAWMLQFTGHHFAENVTYNAPYVSATPFFIGTEPPDYYSIGTDLTATEKAVVIGTNIVSGTTYPQDFLVSLPYTTSPTTTYYRTATAAASITGGVAISGATAATYTIAATAASDDGFYYCAVTNSSGSSTSDTVTLTVSSQANSALYNATASTGANPSPIITTQPTSKTVIAGSSAAFSVVATSATSYQWYKIAATYRAPLETQRAAVSALAISLQADTTNVTAAKLSGTFSDVVMGVTNSGDGNFPFIGTTPTYPTGTTGRGVLYTSLTAAEQAQVKTMIEAWVNTQASDISASLLADYESPAALAATYVGYQVGAGAADGGSTRCNFDVSINQEKVPLNSQNSYLRVDGPRVWVEMVVQAAVAYKSNGFVHYHSLWRDKLADYGNEFGGYLDTTSTSTTYTRPSITTQPTSVTSTSATFTVVAAPGNTNGATSAVTYQWYTSTGTALSGNGATTASYTTSTAGSYYVKVSTAYGTVTSNTVTFTVSGTAPAITTQPTSQSAITGTSVTFSAAASGTATLTYQWYFGGTTIPGATGSTYTIAQTTSASAGTYYVVVTNSYGSATSSTVTLTLTEPFSAYLSTYGLAGVSPDVDSDGDGISNLIEFVLGGDPTVSNTAILPTVSYSASSGTPSLVYTFYTVANLGSATWTVESSPDLTTWTTAAAGTNGVTITTTAYSTAYNLNVATIPDSSDSRLFVRLRATLPVTAQ